MLRSAGMHKVCFVSRSWILCTLESWLASVRFATFFCVLFHLEMLPCMFSPLCKKCLKYCGKIFFVPQRLRFKIFCLNFHEKLLMLTSLYWCSLLISVCEYQLLVTSWSEILFSPFTFLLHFFLARQWLAKIAISGINSISALSFHRDSLFQ